MRIAITGASGLIGRALVASLRADGHLVLPLVRRPSHDPHAVRWDPTAGTVDAGRLEGLDALVHLAGAGIADKRWTDAHKRAIRDSRTSGTDLIARTLAGLDRPPGVFVSGSAIGYYGDRGDEVLTEASPPGAGFLAGVVGGWEASTAPAEEAGIRTVHLRTGIVLSADGGVLPRMTVPVKLFVGGSLGSGEQWMSWITLADHVRATRFLIGRDDLHGPVNVVGPNPVTNAELTGALGDVLGRPTVMPVPTLGLSLLLGRGITEELLLSSQRIRPAALIDAGFTFDATDVRDALRSALSTEPAAA
jgi:uncharacterized protein (TIGR01777 family)